MASIKPEFERRDVKVIGLSVDPVENHEKWAADIEETQGTAPNYPIIADSDFEVSKAFGMLPADVSERILRAVEADPTVEITIDIATKRVSVPSLDIDIEFPLDNSTQDRFLNGLDDIAITLQHVDAITAFEATRPAWMPATNR
jgi:hypothetical protein